MVINILIFLLLTTHLSWNNVPTNVYANVDQVDSISISDIDVSLVNAATQYKKTLAHLARQSTISKSSSRTALLYPRSWTKNDIKLGTSN